MVTDLAGAFDHAGEVLLAGGGTILVVGGSQLASLDQRVVAVRYHSSGTRDTTFDDDGRVVVNLVEGQSEDGVGAAVRPDGKVVVGGWATNGVSGGSGADLAVLLLKPSGALHLPFGGGDGIVFRDFGGAEAPDAMVRQADGKLVFVATRPFASPDPQAIWVFRLEAGGGADAGFGSGGRAEVEFPGGVGGFGLTLDPDDRIVAVGRVGSGSDGDFAAARLLP